MYLKSIFHSLQQTLFPEQCLLCSASTASKTGLCLNCLQDLPVNKSACTRCALPLPPTNTEVKRLCGQCLQSEPPFSASFSPYLYTYPVAQMVARYKFKHHFTTGRVLENILCQAVTQASPDWLIGTDIALTPVPMHTYRLLERGFNQAELLANRLGKFLDRPVINACARISNSKTQLQLNRAQRLKNLRNKFQVIQPVTGKHIILVDDVMTTGATLIELSRVLLKAGARRVDTITLARTP